MNLIATGKIADFIHTHPESRVTLLTWLKESDYWMDRMFANHDGHTAAGFGNGSAQPGTGEIVVNYHINFSAKAVCINDIKTQEEVMQEIKAHQENHSGSTSHVKVVTVTLTPPPPLEDYDHLDEFEATEDTVSVSWPMPAYNYRQDLKQDDRSELNPDATFTLSTEAEYLTALARANSLFNSQPKEWSYPELMSLLPSIERYEKEQLRFPTMSLQEVIMQRTSMFDLPQDYLSMLVGGKDNLDDLLNGKVLPIDTMEILFRTLMLRFPLNDQRFFAQS
ncbi:hypothetical protein ABDD95_19810 [Mucilaginibacter sp. PAMB04274]|uniref:hypothetical protein n=1 Tax=Mucilaginibacter sp. PAMB04274 TaxID=3138568 RepID=UPI0031F613F3